MDITKCSGQDCPIKEKCFRFTSETEPLYQSHFTEIPGNWEKTDDSDNHYWICEMYWGEKSNQILNQLKQIMK